MGAVAPVGMGVSGGSWLKSIYSGIEKAVTAASTFKKIMVPVATDLTKAMAPHVTKSAKAMKKAFKDKDRVKGMTSMFSMLGGMAMGPIGVIMSLLDKLGVVGPIMDVLNGLMSIFSGTLMELLMPAFQDLFDVLLSEDTIALVKLLANIFGMFLVPLIRIFSKSLKIMMPIWMQLATMFSKILAPILPILAKGLGLLVYMGFFPLVLAIYAVGLGIAALIQLFTGVAAIADWNKFMMPMIASMVMGIPEILSMQHGGYVPATTGGQIIRVGEGGEGEHITPESRMNEVIWATEDNGKKLESIYQALVNQGRLR